MAHGDPIDVRDSFAAFCNEARDALVRTADRIVRDRAEAEDVVQDTLAALWRRWDSDRPAQATAYAMRAVTLNALKRRSRRRMAVPLGDGVDPAAPEPAELPISPVQLERALAGLPPPQQVVIRLRYYLGLSLVEIGHQLSISSNTAASRCRYAVAKLRDTLAGGDAPTGHAKERDHGTDRASDNQR